MIEAHGLTKRYGDKLAVDDLTFTVRPGMVTGFLGPNGAGKSTTMRMILGLDAPTGGSVTVNGRPYREHAAPLREVGALLEARSVLPGRSAYHHLLAIAQTGGIARSREVAVSPDGDGALAVSGLSTDEVGRVAGAAGITLLELTAQEASLEDAFMTATRDAVEFRAPATTGADR